MINKRQIFTLIDDQIAAYNAIMHKARELAKSRQKSVVIVKGGPGTGKSVIALEVMGELLRMKKTVVHATGSSAFTNTLRKIVGPRARGLFKFFNSLADAPEEAFDVLVADEAHRTVYSLRAAAGYFGAGTAVEPEGWIDASSIGRLDEKTFVARVVGRSMEPAIKDGDLCVFRANPPGSRQGKVVLVQYRGPSDPETGGAFTVKRYRSKELVQEDGTWQHEEITLEPLNTDFRPIVLTAKEEGDVVLAAEFVAALR
jgi:SOS-response transcriptional repressor LexA